MNDITRVPLTNSNQLCIIDTHNAEKVLQYKWFICNGNHIYRTSPHPQYGLHNFILNRRNNIDHRNRFGWDNRECNLRHAIQSENTRNKTKRKNCSSIYKGVWFDKYRNKWYAYINISNKRTFIGRFNLEVDAAKAYNIKALELHGEFASLNLL